MIDPQFFEIIKSLLAAFAGAFFAFMFLRFSDRIKSKKEKKKLNLRALNKIQFICNENYGTLNDGIYSIDQILRVIEEARKKKQSPYSANRIEKVFIDKEILLDLKNATFLNDYFSYIRTLEKHNNDTDALNHFHESMKMARLSNQISPENYMENMTRFESNLKLFKKFCLDSMSQTESIIAKCRVLMKIETSTFRKLFNRNQFGYSKKISKLIDEEIFILRKEMDLVKQKSKESIEKVLTS